MLKTSYNQETKEVTLTTSVSNFRLIGIYMAAGMGGPGFVQHTMEGLVNAADNTSNDEDYKDQVEAFFDHIRDEHTQNDQQKEIVELIRGLALALPRQTVIAEHLRHSGQSERESFNA